MIYILEQCNFLKNLKYWLLQMNHKHKHSVNIQAKFTDIKVVVLLQFTQGGAALSHLNYTNIRKYNGIQVYL